MIVSKVWCRRRGNKRDHAQPSGCTTLHTFTRHAYTAFTLTYMYSYTLRPPTSANRMILLGLGWKSKLKSKTKEAINSLDAAGDACPPSHKGVHGYGNSATVSHHHHPLILLLVLPRGAYGSRNRGGKKKSPSSSHACSTFRPSTHTKHRRSHNTHTITYDSRMSSGSSSRGARGGGGGGKKEMDPAAVNLKVRRRGRGGRVGGSLCAPFSL